MSNTKSQPPMSTASESAACISDIFLHRNEEIKAAKKELINYISNKKALNTEYKEKTLIYPEMVEIRPTNSLQFYSRGLKGGRKQKITEFSSKSRRNFIKFLCMLKLRRKLWQDFTFPDDVMADKSTFERRDYSNQVLNRFRRHIIDKYPEMGVVWKREWMPRRSGVLVGDFIPHFHMFITDPTIHNENQYLDRARKLAEAWVRYTGTEQVTEALSVALHVRSYRLINNHKHALTYASKYVTKKGTFNPEQSIGRTWGHIGNVETVEPFTEEMTADEMVKIRRAFRKLVPKRHYLQKILKQQERPLFVIVNSETMKRLLDWIRKTHEEEALQYFEGIA